MIKKWLCMTAMFCMTCTISTAVYAKNPENNQTGSDNSMTSRIMCVSESSTKKDATTTLIEKDDDDLVNVTITVSKGSENVDIRENFEKSYSAGTDGKSSIVLNVGARKPKTAGADSVERDESKVPVDVIVLISSVSDETVENAEPVQTNNTKQMETAQQETTQAEETADIEEVQQETSEQTEEVWTESTETYEENTSEEPDSEYEEALERESEAAQMEENNMLASEENAQEIQEEAVQTDEDGQDITAEEIVAENNEQVNEENVQEEIVTGEETFAESQVEEPVEETEEVQQAQEESAAPEEAQPEAVQGGSESIPLPMDIQGYCQTASAEAGFDLKILESLVYTESRGNPGAKNGSHIGLTQINPRYFGDKMASLGVTDLYEPLSNVRICAQSLAEWQAKYGNVYLALDSWHLGEGSAAAANRTDGTSYSRTIVDRAASWG